MSVANLTTQDAVLSDLAFWLGRAMQYAPSHPSCVPLGARVYGTLSRALQQDKQIAFGVSKDNVRIAGDIPATHPAVRHRLAPHLHERGVLLIRFLSGVTQEELVALVELFVLPITTIFDRGGLAKLASERGIVHVQIEEIAHDITAEERESARRRKQFKQFFAEVLANLLAQRSIEAIVRHAVELLEHPDIAISLLEDDPVGIAEAVAGLCLMVKQQEDRAAEAGEESPRLAPKLKPILTGLSQASRDRVLLGLPPLIGDFRTALLWAIDALTEDELAKFAFPSVRRHASDLDVVLYALGIAAPHTGHRMGTLRRLALYLYDLPADDGPGVELLMTLAVKPGDADSYWRERDILAEHAARSMAARQAFAQTKAAAQAVAAQAVAAQAVAAQAVQMGALAPSAASAFDGTRALADVVYLSSRTQRFDRLCARLPAAAQELAATGAVEPVIALVRALREVTRPEWREVAAKALSEIASPQLVNHLLSKLDQVDAAAEGAALDEITRGVKLLTALAPRTVLEHLETAQSRKLRRILIEALSAAGPTLLPALREKLQSPQWFVVRNVVALMPRVSGSVRDLAPVISHPNEKVRVEVARSLRLLPGDDATMEIAASYLEDPSPEVRQQARFLLRPDMLTPRSVALLEYYAGDERKPEDTRRFVVGILGASRLDDAAGALFRLLQPRGLIDAGSLRDAAAVALKRSPASSAAHWFNEGLRSSVWRVRKACERAQGGGGD